MERPRFRGPRGRHSARLPPARQSGRVRGRRLALSRKGLPCSSDHPPVLLDIIAGTRPPEGVGGDPKARPRRERMAIAGIMRPGFAQVRVLDMPAAIEFYTKRIGLHQVTEGPDGRVYQ